MSSENKKDKFKFVTMEEVSDKLEKKLEESNISIVDTPSTVNVSKFDYEEDIINEDDSEEETIEEVEEVNDEVEEVNDKVVVEKEETKKVEKEVDKDLDNEISGKFHFSFEARIITMIVLILIMFCGACTLIYKAISYKGGEKFTYSEYSNTSYEVCYNASADSKCLKDGLRYDRASIEKIIPTFNYTVELSEDIDYSEIKGLRRVL